MDGNLLNAQLEGVDEFGADQLSAVDSIINNYRNKPGSLIPVLEDIQDVLGYIPNSIQERVARGLVVPLGEVRGVVTFYHFFTMVPRGKHTCRVCLGTACYVRGSKKNLDKLAEILKVEPGETTDDRLFSLETVRCLGACGLAPAMVIDQETFPRVKPAKIQGLLENFD